MSAPIWLYEDGIGEERALRLERGQIVAARLLRDDDRAHAAGAVVAGRLGARRADGARAQVTLDEGIAAEIQPVPPGLSEGAAVLGVVVREALVEPGCEPGTAGRRKPLRLRPVDAAAPAPAPRLIDQLRTAGEAIEICTAHGPDRLAKQGWHGLIEEAESGLVGFPGGTLQIIPTAAMTVIDIDGTAPPQALAIAAATAAAQAIARHDIGGSVVIDFPTLAERTARAAVAEAFDAAMPLPCERTALNGFGLMQVVLRRSRRALPELLRADPVLTRLLAALRSAERDMGTGPVQLLLDAAAAARLQRHDAWVDALARRTGRPVEIARDGD